MKIIQGWSAWQQTLGLWLLAVVYIFIMGGLGVSLFPALIEWGTGIPDQILLTPTTLPNWFVRWDSGYYLKIAEQGYSPQGTERAFYPLYPLLVRWLSAASGFPLTLSGLLISLTAFAGATYSLYAWVRLDHPHALALTATAVFCFSPVSFYFVAFYPEALFLCLSLVSLYCLRRGWFLAGGLVIAITGATRPTAFLLSIVYIVEVLYQRPRTLRTWAAAITGALIAPLGMVAYFTYIGYSDGLVAGFAAYGTLLEQEWDTKYAWPWVLVINALTAVLFETSIHPDWFSRAYTLHDLAFAMGGLASACGRRVLYA